VGVEEHTVEVAGSPVFLRRAPASGLPVVYLHGLPTSSDDWVESLSRTGGIAPDLIGFGRSGKGGQLEMSIPGLAGAVLPLLPEGRFSLVAHDWGAPVALELAARRPERVAALVLCNPLPLVEGFTWAGPARLWHRPGLGELVMGATSRWMLGRTLRRGAVSPGTWSPERVAAVWRYFDQGTQRAILRLHRGTDPHWLEDAAPRLTGLTAPILVLWGEADPWLPAPLGERLAERLPRATFERVGGAGHWPWLDQPEILDRLHGFLADAAS
jgi:pimeloyl-ACP methyl ester carboxylesterase